VAEVAAELMSLCAIMCRYFYKKYLHIPASVSIHILF
jgi:hypothetical protein